MTTPKPVLKLCARPGCDNRVSRVAHKFCSQECARQRPVRPACVYPGCQKPVTRIGHKFCSPEHARQASRETAIAHVKNLIAGNETPEQRLLRENTQLGNELKKVTGALQQLRDMRSLENRLAEDILGFIKDNPYRPTLIKPPKKDATAGDHEMLLCLSDAHFPEVVEPGEALGLEYNPDICRKRIQYTVEKTIRYKHLRESAYPVRKLTIAVLGDLLGGNIHPELEATNAFPLSEALVQMGYMLHDAGRSFANDFREVEMIILPGNHARHTIKPRAKRKWDNWEHVMGHLVKALAGDAFRVVVPKDIVYRHKIFHRTVGLTHGDGVKVASFAGIPFYGLRARREAMQSMLRQLGQTQLDYLIMGHFHELLYWPSSGCDLLINGAIKGGDEYSISSLYRASAAVQALLTFHCRHGLTDLSRIDLDHVK